MPGPDIESRPSNDNQQQQQQQQTSTRAGIDLTSADIDDIINAVEEYEESVMELPPPTIFVPSALGDQEGHITPPQHHREDHQRHRR